MTFRVVFGVLLFIATSVNGQNQTCFTGGLNFADYVLVREQVLQELNYRLDMTDKMTEKKRNDFEKHFDHQQNSVFHDFRTDILKLMDEKLDVHIKTVKEENLREKGIRDKELAEEKKSRRAEVSEERKLRKAEVAEERKFRDREVAEERKLRDREVAEIVAAIKK